MKYSEARELLRHPRRPMVKFCERERGFYVFKPSRQSNQSVATLQWVRGMLRPMKRAFFGNYAYSWGTGSGGGERNGRTTGRRVDEEVTRVVDRGAEAARSVAQGGARGKRESRYRARSRRVLRAVEERQLEAVGAQFAIYDPVAGVATALDLVLAHRGRRGPGGAPLLCLGEVKHYTSDWEQSNGMMSGPLHDIENSPRNQAFLQLALPWLMLQRHYGLEPYNAYLFKVDGAGTTSLGLRQAAPWTLARGQAIYEHFVQHCQRTVPRPRPSLANATAGDGGGGRRGRVPKAKAKAKRPKPG